MKNISKKIISVASSAALLLSSGTFTSFAADNAVEAVGSYADTFHFELKMADTISGSEITSLDKVSLTNQATGQAVAITADKVSISDDTFRFEVPLEADTDYTLSVGAGFGTESTTLSRDYDVAFNVTTLWDQKFDDSSVQLIGNLIRAYRTEDSASNNYLKIEGGRLWSFDGMIAPIVSELATEKNVTFSYDFYPYSKAANNYYIGFNSKQLTISATDLKFNMPAKEMRSFGWTLFMPSGQDKTNATCRRFFNSGVFTIVDNPGEGYKIGDTYYWQSTSNGYRNVWVDSDGNRYYDVDGVGKLDAVAYRGQAGMNINGYGDASFDASSKTYTVNTEPAVTKVRVEKQDSVGTLVSNGVVADTYDTLVSGTPGYFSIYNAGGIAAYDNMLITAYNEKKAVDAVGSYADTFHFELKMPETVTGSEIKFIEKVSLREQATGNSVEIAADDVSIADDTFRFDVPLKADTAYVLSVGAGFGTEAMSLKTDYAVQFGVNTIWIQDFNEKPEQLIGNIINAYYQDSEERNQIVVQDGKLWGTDATIVPRVAELATKENVTFSFDIERYAKLSDSTTVYAYDPDDIYIWFNALNMSSNNSTYQFSQKDINTRRYGWRMRKYGDFFRGHVAANYTVKVATGDEYKVGDLYWWQPSVSYQSDFSVVWPDQQTKEVDGVGTLDRSAHYGSGSYTKFVPGDVYYDSANKKYTVYHQGETLPNTIGDVTTSQREAVTKSMRIEKQGNVGALVYDNDVLDVYDTVEDRNTGYFALYHADTAAYDNMLITSYDEIETATEVTLIGGDSTGISLNTPISFGAVNSFDGLEITNANTGAAVVPTSAAYTDNSTLRINAALESDIPYKLSVKSGFAGQTAVFSGDYTSNTFIVVVNLNLYSGCVAAFNLRYRFCL